MNQQVNMINYKIFRKISLLVIFQAAIIMATTNYSLIPKNRTELVVSGYLRGIFASFDQKNYDIKYLLQTVYAYYSTTWKMGNSFCSKKEKHLIHMNAILVSLAPCDPNGFIFYRVGESKLKKFKIRTNHLFLDSVLELSCLANYHAKSIVFLPPQYLFIGLGNGQLYILTFLGKSLSLSTNQIKGIFFASKKFQFAALHELKINRMIPWGNQLLIIEPYSPGVHESYTRYQGEVKISKFEFKDRQLYFNFTIDHRLGLYDHFLTRSLRIRSGTEETGYYYLKYPFFTLNSHEKNFNKWPAISKSEDGLGLFVHEHPGNNKDYHAKVCCFGNFVHAKDASVHNLNNRFVATVGQFIITKYDDQLSEYACAYNTRSGKTYHKVVKLGSLVEIYDAFCVDEYTFILVTMVGLLGPAFADDLYQHLGDIPLIPHLTSSILGNKQGNFAKDVYQDASSLPFIHDRSNKGLGHQQVLLMQWKLKGDAEKFFSVLEEEDEKKDHFTKRLYDWIKKTAGFDDFDYLVELLGDIIDDSSYRKQVNEELNELQGYGNHFDMTREHLEILKRTRERLAKKDSLQARVIDYKVFQNPVYFFFCKGGHLVGVNSQGVHVVPIKLQ